MPRFKLKFKKPAGKPARGNSGPPEATSEPRQLSARAFPPECWAELFDRLGGGETVAEIVGSNEGWPAARKLHQAISANPTLMEEYRQARRAALMGISEDLLPIADDGRNDFMTREDAKGNVHKSVDSETIQRSKLRIETRLRLLEALEPETFGKKLDLSNKDGTLAQAWVQALGVVNNEKENATKH